MAQHKKLKVLCTLEEKVAEEPRQILVSSCEEWGCVALTIPDCEGNGTFIIDADELEKAIHNARNH